MARGVLITDRNKILNSHMIQIVHKHPDLAKPIRSDLDHEELVLEAYPIALANKIIPFLEKHQDSKTVTTSLPSPPRRKYQRKKATTTTSAQQPLPPPPLTPSVPSIHPPEQFLVPHTSPIKFNPFQTPRRQLLPSPSFSPYRGILSPTKDNIPITPARTISPTGRVLSPLKLSDTTPARILFSRPEAPDSIPSAFFSPPHPKPLPRALPHVAPFRRGPGRRPPHPAPLIEFDPLPRRIECGWPRPTLTLRHNVCTAALRDVFVWATLCVEFGRVVDVESLMGAFRDRTRVIEIKEVAVIFEMKTLRGECERLLERWQSRGEDEDDLDGEIERHSGSFSTLGEPDGNEFEQELDIAAAMDAQDVELDEFGNAERHADYWNSVVGATSSSPAMERVRSTTSKDKEEGEDADMEDVPLAQLVRG